MFGTAESVWSLARIQAGRLTERLNPLIVPVQSKNLSPLSFSAFISLSSRPPPTLRHLVPPRVASSRLLPSRDVSISAPHHRRQCRGSGGSSPADPKCFMCLAAPLDEPLLAYGPKSNFCARQKSFNTPHLCFHLWHLLISSAVE